MKAKVWVKLSISLFFQNLIEYDKKKLLKNKLYIFIYNVYDNKGNFVILNTRDPSLNMPQGVFHPCPHPCREKFPNLGVVPPKIWIPPSGEFCHP